MNQNIYQKTIFTDEDGAHGPLLDGARILYKAVKSTMGPSGHNVVIAINQGSPPYITKDGVTVARAIKLKDKLSSVGAELLKEIAAKTNEMAGDGPQPLYSKVMTPHGWKTMGELKIGDEICGTNNTTQKVLGIYPKGIKNVLQIFTSDGRIAECCEDHLWKITTDYGKQYTLTARELLQNNFVKINKIGLKRYKYYLPTTCIEYIENDNLPLDPYLLGVLLGDGSLSAVKRCNVELAIGLKEEYILDRLILPKNCAISKTYDYKKHYIKVRFTNVRTDRKSTIKKSLIDLGLLGTNSYTKFIPKLYLFSSVKNRQKLLDGLIDTDGHVNKRGLFEYSTVSTQLYLDFIDLCRSLGKQVYAHQVSRKPNNGSYSDKPIYRVCELKGYKYGNKITNIVQTNKQTEMQCIKVSNNDNLYITDDFVVTHNTSTATVLGYALLEQGIKRCSNGVSAIEMKKGMDYACAEIISWLKSNAIKIRNDDDIVAVGTISANGDKEIGELLKEAIKKVGQDGIVTIEPAKSIATTLEVIEGMQFDNGYVSPYFVTDQEKLSAELIDPYILVTNKKLSQLKEILPVLELIANTNKPLLIIGDEFDNEVLSALVLNKLKGVLFSCAVKAPSYGDNRIDILQDIAIVTGGVVLDMASGISLQNIELSHLGKCSKVVVTRTSTTLIGTGDITIPEKISDRVESLRCSLDNDHSLDDLKRHNIKKRLAKLAGGIAVIKVGGSTEVEIFEKKDRVEDALNATMAATQEGILPGGGTSLFYAAMTLEQHLEDLNKSKTEDEISGIKVVIEACKTPLRVIVENTGKSPDVVMNNLIEWKDHRLFDCETSKQTSRYRRGYDASKHVYCDLIDTGIMDPLKVERFALEHAVSVISLLLTANCIIISEDQEEKKE